MGKSAVFDNQFLLLTFNATAIPNIADNTATSPLVNLYVALHTSDPTAAGNQSSNEASYSSYARVAVARLSSGWAVTANSCSPVAPINFPTCTGGANTITFFSIGYQPSGAGEILYSGTVTPNAAVTNGVTPQLTTASTITES